MQSSAKSALVNLVEEHLTGLIREASCVQRHAKRARLIENGDGDLSIRRRITADDINLALQWRKSEKIYASSKHNNNAVVVVENEQDEASKRVDLNAYLASEAQVHPPSELALTVHWLAVDGTQPEIPQNPITTERHLIVSEDEMNTNNDAVQIQQLLPRVLSEELQLYCTRITLAVERGGANPTTRQQQDLALQSLQDDSGIQELVPFLVHYVVKQVYAHVGNPEHCRTLVRMAKALLSNPHLHLELHLPHLLSALMTLVVAKKLSSRPFENQWALRTEAAQALLQACNLFGEKYTTLKARILKTLVETIDDSSSTEGKKPLTTIFGGITALSLFGVKAIDAFLLPIATNYFETWETALSKQQDEEQRVQLQQCQQALLDALSVFMKYASLDEIAERLDRVQLVDVFGERLVPLQSEPADYIMCVV